MYHQQSLSLSLSLLSQALQPRNSHTVVLGGMCCLPSFLLCNSCTSSGESYSCSSLSLSSTRGCEQQTKTSISGHNTVTMTRSLNLKKFLQGTLLLWDSFAFKFQLSWRWWLFCCVQLLPGLYKLDGLNLRWCWGLCISAGRLSLNWIWSFDAADCEGELW